MKYYAIVILLVSCSKIPPSDVIQECRERAEERAHEKADKLCGNTWDTCPHAAEIDRKLADELKGCL